MKFLVLCLALVPSFALATPLGDLVKAVKASGSNGKLIDICGSNSTLYLADGSTQAMPDPTSTIQFANVLCDLSKAWNATSGDIYCIAK